MIFYVNSVLHPCPDLEVCWKAGHLLKRFIEAARPDGERAVLLAAGGLSHWLAVPGEGRVNEAWDQAFMQALVDGRGESLTVLTPEAIEAEAGNGGLEVAASPWPALCRGRGARSSTTNPSLPGPAAWADWPCTSEAGAGGLPPARIRAVR